MTSVKAEKSATEQSNEDKTFQDATSQLFDLRTTKGQVLFLIVTVLISCCIQLLPKDTFPSFYTKFSPSSTLNPTTSNCSEATIPLESIKRPKYAIYGRSRSDEHLKHVHGVLQRLGLEQVAFDDEWDLLWAHDYPFRVHAPRMKNLKPHQKVNHFPGCGYITSKLELSTTNVPHVPKSFKLPLEKDKFLEYTKQHPAKLFVQKHNEHRHIYIKSVDEIDFNSNETFIQEFIHNPYLVDGYKFDIGVYVIITSVDPLRVYIYKGDVLFRYCPVKYHPFDAKNVDKYIVGDDYLPSWEVPSLSPYYNDLGFGMKDSFDAYVRSHNQDPDIIWKNVEEAILSIILEKEKHIVDILKNYKSKRNFFEMIRFDLVIDDKLNAYLMEANMSPNLSSAHFKMNTLLYEQVLYSLLNLIGIGSPVKRSSFKKRTNNVEEMISAEKNIVVHAEICAQSPCTESCSTVECKLCKPCLSDEDLDSLHSAFREHIHRVDTKRIFPVRIGKESDYDFDKATKDLTQSNKMMSYWFHGKCKMESSWCT